MPRLTTGIRLGALAFAVIAFAAGAAVWSSCATPNDKAPTGDEDAFSGNSNDYPHMPPWHDPASDCLECHVDGSGPNMPGWHNEEMDCTACHTLPPVDEGDDDDDDDNDDNDDSGDDDDDDDTGDDDTGDDDTGDDDTGDDDTGDDDTGDDDDDDAPAIPPWHDIGGTNMNCVASGCHQGQHGGAYDSSPMPDTCLQCHSQ